MTERLFACQPTPRERAERRWTSTRNQASLFTVEPDELTGPGCPVCASTGHDEPDCPHGSALRLI